MIDSQPSASPARETRASSRRQKVIRRSAATRPDGSEISRWKIQLELAPSEIAFVYRKGLTRGAEVCRRGTHEWRPLVTTPELREALASRASLAEMIEASPAMTLSQTLAINDPTLAALFLQRRAPQLPKSAPPPPPAVARSVAPPPLQPRAVLPKPLATSEPPPMTFTTTAETIPPPPRAPRFESISDTEDTKLMPLRSAPARLSRVLAQRAIVHARPFELSLVAGLAIVSTLLVTAVTLRFETPRMNTLVGSAPHSPPNSAAESHTAAPPAAAPMSTIPVVPVVDLPVEAGRGAMLASIAPSSAVLGGHPSSATARAPSAASTPTTPSVGPDRAALARALGGAAAAARNCGEGPVSAQVVVTYAGSGVARNIHFASPPPVALRSCVLNAVARSRVAPFTGDPVTVSKTLRW